MSAATVARLSRTCCRAATALASLASCQSGPIAWAEPQPLPPELASAQAIEFGAKSRLVAGRAPDIPPPVFPAQCAASVRVARDTAGAWYAVWWSVRPDSTADVVASSSTDARDWSAPVRVDSTDTGRVGCRRPPPAIVADRGNVHVAYAMTAKEGPGIFASHSMDRGAMFHSPVAVVYGERIGLTAIAARGDVVAVAYEDPNSEPRRIGLALSRTMAHLFQSRMLVSPATGAARAPGVALGDGTIVVTWWRGTSPGATRIMRTGDLQ